MRRYIHVFPVSEFFSEIRDCYRSAASRIPWMSTDDLPNWTPDRVEWQNRNIVVIFWGRLPEEIPTGRSAVVVFRYTESVGDTELLAEVQVELMRSFAARAGEPDLLLAGCPAVADYWSRIFRSVAVAPMGYEPAILGTPNRDVRKKFDLAFRGHYIDRRTWIANRLQKRYFSRLLWIHDFGLKRKAQLDACRVDLYIGHSVEYGFPGARLWQSIASSAALATEPRDAWPAVAGRHYIELPQARQENISLFFGEIDEILSSVALDEISLIAHRELSVYTVDRCMTEFVVPAVEKVSA